MSKVKITSVRISIFSIIDGVVITLLTGLIPNITTKPPPPWIGNLRGHPFFGFIILSYLPINLILGNLTN